MSFVNRWFLGYIRNNTLRTKKFLDEDEMLKAKSIFIQKGIPVIELGVTGWKTYANITGTSREAFIQMFVECGHEIDIGDERHSMIEWWLGESVFQREIIDHGDYSTIVINGRVYSFTTSFIKQDEQFAETYGSYNGYDKVGIYQFYHGDRPADGEEIAELFFET